jgi:hypothetical protein
MIVSFGMTCCYISGEIRARSSSAAKRAAIDLSLVFPAAIAQGSMRRIPLD